ncbi:MAG: orotate phosphoribosyltransferase [Bryobacteraceae bacterium]|nr:orotate phosphoribosyltransferase [Bryobacteraceae bacterium]
MDLSEQREKLAGILRKFSVRRGEEFTLASGRRSNVYVDARTTTLRAEAMPLIGRLILAKIAERGWKPSAAGGLTMGADPVAAAVARESLDIPPVVNAFIVRKEAKKHGLQKRIEGVTESGALDVVIVEDVATTGGSAAQAIAACREAGWNVLGVVALVDREEGAAEAIERDCQCPFDRIFRLSDL